MYARDFEDMVKAFKLSSYDANNHRAGDDIPAPNDVEVEGPLRSGSKLKATPSAEDRLDAYKAKKGKPRRVVINRM